MNEQVLGTKWYMGNVRREGEGGGGGAELQISACSSLHFSCLIGLNGKGEGPAAMEHDEHVHSCWAGSGCFPLLSPSASRQREEKRTRIETSQIKSLASALSFPLLDVHERWGPCWDKCLKSSRRPSDVLVRRKPGCMGWCLFSLLFFFFLAFFFPYIPRFG